MFTLRIRRGAALSIVAALLLAAGSVGRAQTAPSLAPASDDAAPAQAEDTRITLELSDGSTLKGHPVGDARLRLATTLGELPVPLEKIAGVQFGPSRAETVILLANGDRITGELSGGPIAIKAPWGELSVNLDQIAAIGTRETVINTASVADRLPDGSIERRVVAEVKLKGHQDDNATAENSAAEASGEDGRIQISPSLLPDGRMYSDSGLTGQLVVDEVEVVPLKPVTFGSNINPDAGAPGTFLDDIPAPEPADAP